ncbi:MAG: MYXO-CTERM sorting domain-containing protein [bacterium]
MRRNKALKWAISVVFIFAVGASCNSSGCEILQPMPDGNEVPPNQTIEGGMQVRVTADGFDKISSIIPGILENSGLGAIELIAPGTPFEVGSCGTIDWACIRFQYCPTGCGIDVSIPQGGVDMYVDTASNMLMLDLTIDVAFVLDAHLEIDIMNFSVLDITCGLGLTTLDGPLHVTVGIEPYIRPEDGELRIRLGHLSNLDISGFNLSLQGCGIVGDYLNTYLDYVNDIIDIIDSILGNAITDFIMNQFLLPMVGDMIDGFVPDPLGLEGQFDVGSLLAGFSPGAEGVLELRLTPGGYVNLLGNGMSLGVITGVNSDADPTTRSATLDPATGVRMHSEPHRKMPPMPTPDFTGVLASAPARSALSGTPFKLDAASELGGFNDSQYLRYKDPNSPLNNQIADLAIGTPETFLDLLGFHLLNSGALCLEIGTQEVDMLTVGLFSIMVSSLGDLVDPLVGDAPMRLVIRPQTPMDFWIGNPLDQANPTPLLNLYLQDFQIDMYAWSEERYTRAFTMAVDMELGLNLLSEVDPNDGTLYLKPVLEDVNASDLTVRIHNSELIGDSPEELEALFPSVLSMLMPMITGMLPDIAMPELMGLSMEYLEFRPNDAQNMMLILANIKLPSNPVPPAPVPVLPVRTSAELVDVYVPTPAEWRRSQLDESVPAAEKDVPTVRIAVNTRTADSSLVEWQYRLNAGAWRGFRPGPELVLTDQTFTFQGWHHIEVRGRVRGEPRSLERQPVSFDVLIDSTPPLQKATVEDDTLIFNGFDLVTARTELRYSYEFEPGNYSSWSDRGSMPLSRARTLAKAHGGVLRVRVMDEAGNVSEAEIDESLMGAVNVDPKVGGCGCATSGNGEVPFAVLFLGLLGVLFFRRGRSARPAGALLVVGVAALLALGGCAKKAGAGDPDATVTVPCTDDDECVALQCEDDQIPLCIDGECQCMDDLLFGKTGPYTSLSVSYSDVMVAAYNTRYGDLMYGHISKNDIGSNPIITNWEFVDGVPWDQDPDVPTSEIRGGIRTKGDNVGRFTSIGTDDSGQPVIAYYDVTHGALKIARHDGTNWQIFVVDDGGNSESAEGGDAGRYTSMSMRPSDRAPGVAYLVQDLPSNDTSATITQVRFAQAITASPMSGADWMIYIVDELAVPVLADDAPLPDLPMGVGVTTSVDRTSDGRPVVVYYDSYNGNLKGAEFDDASQQFFPPIILDGDDGAGTDTGNVGLSPSVRIRGDDTVWHVSYMDAALKQLLYLRTGADSIIEVVDDGLREEVNDLTGLPMPISHFVGYDSKITVAGSSPDPAQNKVFIAYSDSTTHELLWAVRDPAAPTPWITSSIIGGDPAIWNSSLARFEDSYGEPWQGAYGFYVGLVDDQTTAYLCSYAINEWAESDLFGNAPLNYWVQIFAKALSEG